MQQTVRANSYLFDHFVGEREQRPGHGEAERLGGVEVDRQLELRRLLDGQIGGFGPPENTIGVRRRAPEHVGHVNAIAQQTTGFDRYNTRMTVGMRNRAACATMRSRCTAVKEFGMTMRPPPGFVRWRRNAINVGRLAANLRPACRTCAAASIDGR